MQIRESERVSGGKAPRLERAGYLQVIARRPLWLELGE